MDSSFSSKSLVFYKLKDRILFNFYFVSLALSFSTIMMILHNLMEISIYQLLFFFVCDGKKSPYFFYLTFNRCTLNEHHCTTFLLFTHIRDVTETALFKSLSHNVFIYPLHTTTRNQQLPLYTFNILATKM